MKNELTGHYIATPMSPNTRETMYRGWSPIIMWCTKTFGKSNNGYTWSYIGLGKFEFVHERDYVMFLLRWA